MSLCIYKSSAGSGKTYNLAREYLQIVLKDPRAYRYILAITFTNKATAEMKGRILKFLSLLAEESPDTQGLADDLVQQTGIAKELIPNKAKDALTQILHDYSRFSVSTIDSFFQFILRSFSAELGLYLQYDVELDNRRMIDWMVDTMLASIKDDKDLNNWLKRYVFNRIEEGKSVPEIKTSFKNLAGELFSENYSCILQSIENKQPLYPKDFFSVVEHLNSCRNEIRNKFKESGEKAIQVIEVNGFTDKDFFQGNRGVYKFFFNLRSVDEKFALNSYVQQCLNDPEKWVSAKHQDRDRVMGIVSAQLHPILVEVADFHQSRFSEFLTAGEILKNIYVFGVLNYLADMKLRYIAEFNQITPHETMGFVNDLIKEAEDAPFIFEKTGSYIKHLLIDEAQDTSGVQWKSLKPLIENSLSGGGRVVIVGDVKQSIYRWRGGDLGLLMHKIEEDLVQFPFEKKVLANNWRSLKNVIFFNNKLYDQLALFHDYPWKKIPHVYEGHEQHPAPAAADAGYVEAVFLEEEKEGGVKWQEKAIVKTVEVIRELIGRGFSYKQIGLVIRKNKEGVELAKAFKQEKIPFISSESLFVQNSETVRFIISVLKLSLDPLDGVSKAFALKFYYEYVLTSSMEGDLFYRPSLDVSSPIIALASSIGPLNIFEAIEKIISFYKISDKEPAYLQRIQDLSLEYLNKFGSDIFGFIKWWDEEIESGKTSVIVPEGEDAVQIVTVHKSKGLEYPVVIMPFACWSTQPKSRSILWGKIQDQGKYKLEYSPLSSSQALLMTDFGAQYLEEWQNNFIDEINSLYVGTTRAESELYLISKLPSDVESLPSFEKFNDLNVFLYMACKFMGMVESEANAFLFGSKDYTLKAHKGNKGPGQLKLDSYPLGNSSEVRIASSGSSVTEAVRKGLVLHQIMERVNSVRDIPMAVRSSVLEGALRKDEAKNYEQMIQNLLHCDPQMIEWFSGNAGWVIYKEQELFDLGGNKICRPDRIMTCENKAVVLDYKVSGWYDENGIDDEKEGQLAGYKRQLLDYARLVRKLGYGEVDAYLLFTNEGKLMKVD
ncbi:MAG: UvrD-helicase domain-containing protein [Cytophagaceae bacterium]